MLPRVVRFPAKFTDRRSRSLRGLFVLRFHQAATRINRFLCSGGTVSFSARKRGLIAAIKVFHAVASFRVSPRSTRTRCRRRERDREKQKIKKNNKALAIPPQKSRDPYRIPSLSTTTLQRGRKKMNFTATLCALTTLIFQFIVT